MTTAEILSTVNAIAKADSTPYITRAALESLSAKLADKARGEAASKLGRAGVVAMLTRMLKGVGKSRPALGGTWIDDAGRQCLCDGFRAYRLQNHLPLPVSDDPHPINLAKIINPDRMLQGTPLTVPDRQRLKAFIGLQRAANGKRGFGPCWNFGDGLPVVNACYLLELLQVFPDAKLYATGLYNPIYAVSADGDGALLPVRVNLSDIDPQTILTTARNRSTDATPDFTLYEFAAWRRATC